MPSSHCPTMAWLLVTAEIVGIIVDYLGVTVAPYLLSCCRGLVSHAALEQLQKELARVAKILNQSPPQVRAPSGTRHSRPLKCYLRYGCALYNVVAEPFRALEDAFLCYPGFSEISHAGILLVPRPMDRQWRHTEALRLSDIAPWEEPTDLLDCLETTLGLPGDFLDAWLQVNCNSALVDVVAKILKAGSYEVTFYDTNVQHNRHALLLIDFRIGSFVGTFAAEEAFVDAIFEP